MFIHVLADQALPWMAALAITVGCGAAWAAPGELDHSFGSGGIVVTQAPLAVEPTSVLLQPDGKIVVIGELRNAPQATMAIALVRYFGDGSVDKSFGHSGQASTQITNFINYANAAALQPDGKILVAGEAQSADGTLSEFVLVRFEANGTLDQHFGTRGKMTTNFVGVRTGGVSNPANSVLVQADGKILVGGSVSQCPRNCGGRKTALARYGTDGSLDKSFGSNGMVSVIAIGSAMTLAEDGAGNIFALNGAQVTAFSPTGTLRPTGSFSSVPLAVRTHANFQSLPAIFQPDGRYVVAASAKGITRHDIDAQAARYELTGLVDASFSNAPFDFAEENAITQDTAQAVDLHANGQIVLAGLHQGSGAGGIPVFGLARLNTDGALDSTFGSGGTVTTAVPGFINGAFASAVLVQPDDKIVAVGIGLTSDTINPPGLVLVRYLGR